MKISVITSAYNAQSTLSRTINSVLTQTFTDFEYLVIDHGSTDNTGIIIDEFLKKDSRIKKLVIKKNTGHIGRALNYGIKHAQGDYFAIIDSDDTYKPDFLESMYRRMMEDGSDIAVCGFSLVDQTGRELSVKNATRDYTLRDKADYRSYIDIEICSELGLAFMDFWWNKLYKRQFSCENGGMFDEQSTHITDSLFNMNLYLSRPKISVLAQAKIDYTTYNNASTSKKYVPNRHREYLRYAECWMEFLEQNDFSDKHFKELGKQYLIFLHLIKITASPGSVDEILSELSSWINSDIIRRWVEAIDGRDRMLAEIELTFRLLHNQNENHTIIDACTFNSYYNKLRQDEQDEVFISNIDYIFQKDNWFSLSSQSIVESIICN